MSFRHVKVGDVVTRLLAGKIPMKMLVTHVDTKTMTCGGGWMFDRETGWEEDSDLGWGVDFGRTGSHLIKE